MCVYIYIYIYMYRERERERESARDAFSSERILSISACEEARVESSFSRAAVCSFKQRPTRQWHRGKGV